MNESIEEMLVAAANAFRLGKDTEANEQLAALMESLMTLVQSGNLTVELNDLLAIINEVTLAQQRGDGLWLADLIEYELPHYLT